MKVMFVSCISEFEIFLYCLEGGGGEEEVKLSLYRAGQANRGPGG
jgi:hypothetical protein